MPDFHRPGQMLHGDRDRRPTTTEPPEPPALVEAKLDTILISLIQMESKIMASIQQLTDDFRAFRDAVMQRETDLNAAIKAAVDKALADDEIGDSTALEALDQEIKDAQAALPPIASPPVLDEPVVG